jgi:hypothetical protein
MRVTEEKMKLFEEDFFRFKERTTDLKRTSKKKTAAASSTVEFSQSSSSSCAEASSLYIDVYLPRPSSASAVNPLAASLLEPQAGFIRYGTVSRKIFHTYCLVSLAVLRIRIRIRIEVESWIRICIKVKGRIRIRVRVKSRIRIRSTVCGSATVL